MRRTARFIEVRGTAQAFAEGGKAINGQFAQDMLRLIPTSIVSFEFDGSGTMPGSQQQVNDHGRKVE